MGSVKWQEGGWGSVASDGKTEDGYEWRQIVGRRMGMDGVIW
jgi:hypothetical protein